MVPASNTQHAAIGQVLKDPTAVTEVEAACRAWQQVALAKEASALSTVPINTNVLPHANSGSGMSTDYCEPHRQRNVANLPFFTAHAQASQPAIAQSS